jgi:hypothetical protein
LYRGYTSRSVEAGWQYSKVYEEHVDQDGNPTEAYFRWAQMGWSQYKADRYPMGKGRTPLYSWWDGEKLDYLTARKRIYIPLYARAVVKTEAFAKLKQIYVETGELLLRDFDGYDYLAEGLTIKEVLNRTDKKMGHAFVLAMLLTPTEEWDK